MFARNFDRTESFATDATLRDFLPLQKQLTGKCIRVYNVECKQQLKLSTEDARDTSETKHNSCETYQTPAW